MFISYVEERYKTKEEATQRISILDMNKEKLNISGDWSWGLLSGWKGYEYDEEADEYYIRIQIHCTDEEADDLVEIIKRNEHREEGMNDEEKEYAKQILKNRESRCPGYA